MHAWHVSELEDPFKKRVAANPTICVLTMILFFCLALASLSNAEPLFRLPLHRNMEPLSTNPDAHNVYKRDSGTGFTVSGSCTTSRSGGGYDVHNPTSGDCHLNYGDCSASTSSGGGGYIEKIHDAYNEGSGNFFITYCGESTSGEELIHDVHNVGSGNFHITYRSASTSSEELIHNVYNAGSGQFHIKYSTSNTNTQRRLVNDVRNTGSGPINITYRNCGSRNICGKVANDVYIAGSGNVYISTSSTNNCGALVNNVHDSGSGQIYLKYGIGC